MLVGEQGGVCDVLGLSAERRGGCCAEWVECTVLAATARWLLHIADRVADCIVRLHAFFPSFFFFLSPLLSRCTIYASL